MILGVADATGSVVVVVVGVVGGRQDASANGDNPKVVTSATLRHLRLFTLHVRALDHPTTIVPRRWIMALLPTYSCVGGVETVMVGRDLGATCVVAERAPTAARVIGRRRM
jgi:hypothetical protein